MSLYAGITLPSRPDLSNVQKLDLLPLHQIRRMQRVGVAIDREWFHRLSSELDALKTGLRAEIVEHIPADQLERFVGEAGDEFNPDSYDQVGQLLFQILRVGRGSRLRRTKSGKAISTGKKQLEALKWEHPAIPRILAYREISKLKGTFCDTLPQQAKLHPAGECPVCELTHAESHWRIHATINTTRTVAGRLSMKAPNLQQIPSRTKLGREVRKGFIAAPGKRLVSCDFSQLHLRLVAHLANEPTMIEVFRAGGDIHTETARRANGLGPDEAPDKLTQRDPAKTTNFFILNRGGWQGLFDVLVVNFALAGMERPSWLTGMWCEQFINKWFDLYPCVREWFKVQDYRAGRYGIVWDMFGRVRRIPEMRSVHERVRDAGLRQGGNHPLIGGEAGIYKIAQARIEDRLILLRAQGIGVEAVIPVHDELVLEVDEEWAEYVAQVVCWEMEQALVDDQGQLRCRVPIVAESKIGERWSKE
jgi:DNA polymerase I